MVEYTGFFLFCCLLSCTYLINVKTLFATHLSYIEVDALSNYQIILDWTYNFLKFYGNIIPRILYVNIFVPLRVLKVVCCCINTDMCDILKVCFFPKNWCHDNEYFITGQERKWLLTWLLSFPSSTICHRWRPWRIRNVYLVPPTNNHCHGKGVLHWCNT